MHLAAAYGVYRRPPSTVPTAIFVATVVVCQLANYGCVYMSLVNLSHRVMKDHRRVPPPVLSSLFQCVIWCTRHTRVDGD